MIKRFLFLCSILLVSTASHAMLKTDTIEDFRSICDNELPIEWYDQNLTKAGTYSHKEQYADTLVDSVIHILHLNVFPVVYTYQDTTIYKGEKIRWQGKTYTKQGVYRDTLVSSFGCDSILVLTLTVLYKNITIEDSMTVCENELPIQWYEQTLTKKGTYTHSEQYSDTILDSLTHILHLNVLPVLYSYQDTTIYEGEKYRWRGKTYTKPGIYRDTLKSSFGCDSILVFTLTVLQNNVTVNSINVSEPCSDNAQIDIKLDITGLVDFLKFTFSSEAKAMGMSDKTIPMPSNSHVSLNYGTVRAGKYQANITGIFRNMEVFSEDITLSFRYQSSVLEQRWNDVIAVLTHNYNGGFDFTAFQWYKNGQALSGETNYYLHQPLDFGAEYSVLLTDQNGMQLMTCPFYPTPHTDISLYPTVVQPQEQIQCRMSQPAKIALYNTTGDLVSQTQVPEGQTNLQAPDATGIYMLKITTNDNQQRDVKIIVL